MQQPIVSLITCLVIGFLTYKGFRDKEFESRFIFCIDYIKLRREYYRFLTSGFLHADWQHLLFNIYGFFVFAGSIEFVFGAYMPLTILVLGIIFGNLFTYILHRDSAYRAYGASGGVCAVIFSSIFFFPHSQIGLLLFPIGVPAWVFAILYIIYSTYASLKKNDNIGHDAHLGGALFGVLFVAVYDINYIMNSWLLFIFVVTLTLAYFYIMINNYHYYILYPKKRFEFAEVKQKIHENEERDKRELEALLEMVSIAGYDNLPPKDQKKLHKLSAKMKKKQEDQKRGNDEYYRGRDK